MKLTSDADDIPPGATLIAHFLHHLAGQMDLKMEIFTLGPLSQALEFFTQMKNAGFHPNLYTFNAIIAIYGKNLKG